VKLCVNLENSQQELNPTIKRSKRKSKKKIKKIGDAVRAKSVACRDQQDFTVTSSSSWDPRARLRPRARPSLQD
jgi:hypothetical protein